MTDTQPDITETDDCVTEQINALSLIFLKY